MHSKLSKNMQSIFIAEIKDFFSLKSHELCTRNKIKVGYVRSVLKSNVIEFMY